MSGTKAILYMLSHYFCMRKDENYILPKQSMYVKK